MEGDELSIDIGNNSQMVNETYFEEWPRLQDGRLNCSICENKLCLGEEDYDVYQSYISVDKFETVLICLIAVVFICGIIGNALVFIAVTTTKSMQSVTNIFIVNLAMADMLVMIFCVPPTVIWDVTNTWIFGSLMCRIVLYIQDISVSVSVLTLTFIAYDRYYAICRPLQFSSRKTKAAVVIAAIWTISAIIGIPNAISLEAVTPFDDEEQFPCLARDEIFFDLSSCKPKWGENVDFTITLLKAVVLYSLPIIFMSIAYYHIVKTLWRRNNMPGSQETSDNRINRRTLLSKTASSMHRNGSATASFIESSSRAGTLESPGRIHCKRNISANKNLDNQLRTRRKVAKMLIAVVIIFTINSFPVHCLPIAQLLYISTKFLLFTYKNQNLPDTTYSRCRKMEKIYPKSGNKDKNFLIKVKILKLALRV
ncbi:orexin receptor type 2 isoform X2 [Lepeophtheirus salmonis]|uniref:orexin receptor type 2 isoform X2 n=1 Tax=Lepeophtheirus salmonis TaxID=72036 RepID=UPI003AF3B99F